MSSKTFGILVTLCAIALAAGTALAREDIDPFHSAAAYAAQDKISISRGIITAVDLKAQTFTLQTHKDATKHFLINNNTDYTINDENASAREALRKGVNARVGHKGSTALKVEVMAKKDGQ